MDTTVTIPAGSALDLELEQLASEHGQSKADVALTILQDWLDELHEIREYMSRIDPNEPTRTLEEVRGDLDRDR